MLVANAIRSYRIPACCKWLLPVGVSGLYAVTDEIHQYFVPGRACRLLDVTVDTCGAGDIFGGSAMSQLLKTGKHPGELTAEELKDIVRFACCAASLSTQKQGGISSVPEEAEVRALVNTMA